MHIEIRTLGTKATVYLFGRVDSLTSKTLEKEINKLILEGRNNITIDLFKVPYLSSAGIRVMVYSAKKLSKINGNFYIARATEVVKNMLEITGLYGLLSKEVAGKNLPVLKQGTALMKIEDAFFTF